MLISTVFIGNVVSETARSGEAADIESLRPIGRLRRGARPKAGKVHWEAARGALRSGALKSPRSPAASPQSGSSASGKHGRGEVITGPLASMGPHTQLTSDGGPMAHLLQSIGDTMKRLKLPFDEQEGGSKDGPAPELVPTWGPDVGKEVTEAAPGLPPPQPVPPPRGAMAPKDSVAETYV